jgi:hypothetical protein
MCGGELLHRETSAVYYWVIAKKASLAAAAKRTAKRLEAEQKRAGKPRR